MTAVPAHVPVLVVGAGPDEAQPSLSLVQPAGPRAHVALHPTVVERVPEPGRHRVRVGQRYVVGHRSHLRATVRAEADRSQRLPEPGWEMMRSHVGSGASNSWEQLMQVTVVGSGNGGMAVGFEWAQHGHRVALYGDPEHPDNLDAVCFEPMTAPTDALRHSPPLAWPTEPFRARFSVFVKT